MAITCVSGILNNLGSGSITAISMLWISFQLSLICKIEIITLLPTSQGYHLQGWMSLFKLLLLLVNCCCSQTHPPYYSGKGSPGRLPGEVELGTGLLHLSLTIPIYKLTFSPLQAVSSLTTSLLFNIHGYVLPWWSRG